MKGETEQEEEKVFCCVFLAEMEGKGGRECFLCGDSERFSLKKIHTF